MKKLHLPQTHIIGTIVGFCRLKKETEGIPHILLFFLVFIKNLLYLRYVLYQNLIAACAAANRAIGTRKGEQET